MNMLKETNDVRMIRNRFLRIIARGNCPAMCKMKYWAQLKNAVVREAFRLVGSSAPYEALDAFGLTYPCTLLADLQELYEYRNAGHISDLECASFAHALREDMLTLHAHGDIDAATRSEFEANYAAIVKELSTLKEGTENAKDK